MYNITKKICSLFFPNSSKLIFINGFFKLITKLIKNHGLIHSVKLLKQMRLHCTRYICGSPLLSNDLMIGIDKSGWPKQLEFLKPLLTSGIEDTKFLMTLLLLSRTLKVSGKLKDKIIPDFSTITDPSTCNITIPGGIIREFVEQYNLKTTKPRFKFSNIYLSSKAGPQGPATLSGPKNLYNYSLDLLMYFKHVTDLKGFKYICEQYDYFKSKFPSEEILKGEVGKISYVYDPECKLRLIAIVDYYRQLFLKPINDRLFMLIKNLPQDRTFTQDPKTNWEVNSHSFWSLDLSSATDRFPIHLQMRLLTYIFSSIKKLNIGLKDNEFASNWRKLLVSQEFRTPMGGSVRYAAGQPMGSYSSWISFTLAHHLVVFYAAKLAGIKNFNQYIILGDDIVIKHDIVARNYIRIIERLGVKLSLSKTHVSKDTYEFAKRWFKGGIEITGIPMRGIIDHISNPFIVYTILFDFFKVKGNLCIFSESLISNLFKLYKNLKLIKRNRNKMLVSRFFSINVILKNKLTMFSVILNHAFKFVTYDQYRKFFCDQVTNDEYIIPTPGVVLSEIDRVLGEGLKTLISKKIIEVQDIYYQIVGNQYYGKLQLDEYSYLPLYHSIVNYLQSLHDTAQSWNTKEISILECSRNMVMIDINSIYNKDRNKVQSLYNIGKLWSKGISLINSPKKKATGIRNPAAVLMGKFIGKGPTTQEISQAETKLILMNLKMMNQRHGDNF